MRAFVAVWLPEEVRAAVAQAVAHASRKGDGVAWIAPENLHVTLKFLGDVDDGRVEELETRLRESLRGATPFEAGTGVPGAFPGLSRPRIIHVGLEKGADAVIGLASRVETAMAGAGFAREDRPYHPHITVGRVKDPRKGTDGAARLAAFPPPVLAFHVREIAFVKSELAPAGSRYTVLRSIPLAPA